LAGKNLPDLSAGCLTVVGKDFFAYNVLIFEKK
jgi:hypothetical protein